MVDAAALAALRADPAMAPLRRSLDFYYRHPQREAAMDRLYRRFISPGDLAFDVGAHVGDRVAGFRRLGARVVAVEPMPLCAHALRTLYGRDRDVTVVEAACGAVCGTATLHVNTANPTVCTASASFMRAAEGADGWRGQVWDSQITVATTTLDTLIATHGVPAFTKIDVEGFEESVLAGLSHPLPTLSFEFTTIAREVALRCLDWLTSLGPYRFDVALGETHRLTFHRWVSKEEVAEHLATLPDEANAGDVYCVLPGSVPSSPQMADVPAERPDQQRQHSGE